MIEVCTFTKCTGCGACVQKCPKACIRWRRKGLWDYPEIDTTRCIDCGVCTKSCQATYQNSFEVNGHLDTPKIYALLYNDLEVRKKSTSGAAFYAIAEEIVNSHGIVYGVTIDENFQVSHMRVDSMVDLPKLQGSKYVQSYIGESYINAKDDLESGKTVLFSGTSCQIEGLYRYLGKEYDNLITCDLLCKGVPAQRLFDKYIEFLQKRYNNKVKSFNFREKCLGYFLVSSIELDTKKILLHGIEDTFVKTVGAGYVREACLSCKFTSEHRIGDFSLADFWHIGEKMPINVDTNNGCSLLMVNTKRAIGFVEKLHAGSYIEERTLEEAHRSQSSALSHPNRKPETYEDFFKDAEKADWTKLAKKYLISKSLQGRIREALPRKIERRIVETIKKYE